MNSLDRNTINLKEEHQFSPEILNKDNQTGLCVCGLPQDNPLHGTMNSLNRDMWEDKFQELWSSLVDWVGSGFRFGKAKLTNEGLVEMKPKFKYFIRTLLEEAKAEERKRCLDALPEIEEFANCEDDANFNYGWNSYRNQAISAISNKKINMAITKNINDIQVKTGDGWIVLVRNKPYCDMVEVWFARQKYDGIEMIYFDDKGSMSMTKIEEGLEPEPTMKIPGVIWEGIRQAINGVAETPDKKAVDAELLATKYHLEDMRKIVFTPTSKGLDKK